MKKKQFLQLVPQAKSKGLSSTRIGSGQNNLTRVEEEFEVRAGGQWWVLTFCLTTEVKWSHSQNDGQFEGNGSSDGMRDSFSKFAMSEFRESGNLTKVWNGRFQFQTEKECQKQLAVLFEELGLNV